MVDMWWWRIINSIVIVILAEVVRRGLKRSINLVSQRLSAKKAQTAASVLKNLVKFVVWGLGLVMILSQWGIDISPFLTGAGIVGVAVAFGSQTLVRDIMTGIFLIMENWVGVGDEVEVAGKRGKVVSIKLRALVIKDSESGAVHIIPHSSVGVLTKFKTEN